MLVDPRLRALAKTVSQTLRGAELVIQMRASRA